MTRTLTITEALLAASFLLSFNEVLGITDLTIHDLAKNDYVTLHYTREKQRWQLAIPTDWFIVSKPDLCSHMQALLIGGSVHNISYNLGRRRVNIATIKAEPCTAL